MPEFVINADLYIEAKDEHKATRIVREIVTSLPFAVIIQLGALEEVYDPALEEV